MEYNIKEFIASLPDHRRGQGQRHKLGDVVTMVIMAILSGHQGLKGFARFAKSNEEELTRVLQLKHGVPCFFTFRSILKGLNEELLSKRFIAWVKTYDEEWKDDYISLDGKAVKSSVKGGNNSTQNFIAVVSAFGNRSGIVYGMKSYENKKSCEADTLRELVQRLGLKEKVFTMDALHSQKKHLT
jgi:hypothetical protein